MIFELNKLIKVIKNLLNLQKIKIFYLNSFNLKKILFFSFSTFVNIFPFLCFNNFDDL